MSRRVTVSVVIFMFAALGSIQLISSYNIEVKMPTPVIANVTLRTHNETNLTVDVGFLLCNGTIGDYVWHDKNCDGIQNESDPGLSRILVMLRNDTGLVAQEETNVSGYYLFEDLCPGNYTVDVDESTLPSYLKPAHPKY